MRDFVNRKSKLLQPSGIRKFFDIVRETEGAISLGVGEPDFVTPWPIRSAAIASLQRGYTQYTANRGMRPLLELIARYLEARFSLSFDPAHILVTVGASEAIDLTLRACVEPGDEVLLPDPSYVSYAPCVALSDGVPVKVECREEDGFRLTPQRLEAAITDKTKAIILTYPNNPTGAVMEETALKQIAEIIEKHDLLVISDEIYAELTYGGRHASLASLPGMKKRTAYIGGFSKAFAMTGWRLGYAIAPQHLMDRIKQFHDFNTVGAPSVLMEAAIAGLEMPDSYYEEFGAHYAHMKALFTKGLDDIGIQYTDPQGAYFVLANIGQYLKPGQTDVEFCEEMARKVGVACVPGTSFFKENVNDIIRVHFAKKDDTLMEALNRLADIKTKMA